MTPVQRLKFDSNPVSFLENCGITKMKITPPVNLNSQGDADYTVQYPHGGNLHMLNPNRRILPAYIHFNDTGIDPTAFVDVSFRALHGVQAN